MNDRKRKTIEGWIDKAATQLDTAKKHLKSHCHYSESVEASQECVELSVKSVLSILGIEFPRSHSWDSKSLSKIAGQIVQKQILKKIEEQNLYQCSRLPRLLHLTNFWAQFYLTAKYGMEAGHLASAQELFEMEDAKLAVHHAEECYRAASELRHLSKNKLAAVMSN